MAEVYRPDTVGHLLETDRVLLERVGEEEEPLLQTDGTGVGDPLNDEVAGILDRRLNRLPGGVRAVGGRLIGGL